jgi:hypothetical protein
MQLNKQKQRYTQKQLGNTLLGLQYKVFTDKLNIVFVRENFVLNNRFEDKLYLWSDTIPYMEFDVTTKPGKFWWEGFTNPLGVAGLVENQYIDAYRIGMHQNRYEALVQVKEVTVYRDKNKDLTLDTNITQRGLFGINYHTMNTSQVLTAKVVGNGSAGCMVNPDTKGYFESMCVVKLAQQEFYTKTLLNRKLIEKYGN